MDNNPMVPTEQVWVQTAVWPDCPSSEAAFAAAGFMPLAYHAPVLAPVEVGMADSIVGEPGCEFSFTSLPVSEPRTPAVPLGTRLPDPDNPGRDRVYVRWGKGPAGETVTERGGNR